MKNLEIHDVTLRDGSHAASHKYSLQNFIDYATIIDGAGIDYIEVGPHGNGIGASSIQMGLSKHKDIDVLTSVRDCLKKSKLSVHVIAGYATLNRDIKPAIRAGVDLFRVASMCTEADTTQRHIEYLSQENAIVYGILMMSHLADANTLLRESRKMQNYGAKAIVLMDSAGAYKFKDVRSKISTLVQGLDIPVGFHAHENLGCSVGNSLIAIESGATIIDVSSGGFGAGSGNTRMECFLEMVDKSEYLVNIDNDKILDALQYVDQNFYKMHRPSISIDSILTSRNGLFSGFKRDVQKASLKYGIAARDIYNELGRMNAMGGQEDLIIEASQNVIKNNG